MLPRLQCVLLSLISSVSSRQCKQINFRFFVIEKTNVTFKSYIIEWLCFKVFRNLLDIKQISRIVQYHSFAWNNELTYCRVCRLLERPVLCALPVFTGRRFLNALVWVGKIERLCQGECSQCFTIALKKIKN